MFKSRQRPIGDWRLARAARPWSSFMHVRDQGQWAARFEHVIDRFGDPLTVGPVEGLAKGDQPEPSETERGDVLGQGLHPADVADTGISGAPCALSQHLSIRVECDHLRDAVG